MKRIELRPRLLSPVRKTTFVSNPFRDPHPQNAARRLKAARIEVKSADEAKEYGLLFESSLADVAAQAQQCP